MAGAVFLGEGVFTLRPPTASERKHLARELKGATELEEPFTEAVLLFTDGTFEEPAKQLKFRPEAAAAKAAGMLSDVRHRCCGRAAPA